MIKEAYCSFEVSKLLKEKGFEGECIAYYSKYKDNNLNLYRWRNRSTYVNVRNNGYTLVPTHQMAMTWLREKYNIYISIQPDFPSSKDYKMCWCWTASFLHENCVSLKGYQCYMETYEKATEEAIKYCLKNLI